MASGPNVEGNLSEARRLIARAAEQGARLVVLPEFFAIMGMNDQDKVAVGQSNRFSARLHGKIKSGWWAARPRWRPARPTRC